MSQTFPPVRLAALDLDGTLLNHEGQVTPRTRAALQAASDRGVVIVPTTGRPLGNLPPVVAQLPGVRYAITSNGAAWAATRWVLSTAGTPMRPNARPVSPPVCCAA